VKSLINYPLKVFATGFIVLILLAILLFWGRFLCLYSFFGLMRRDAQQVSMEPSGLMPPKFEIDPNIIHHSKVSAGMNTKQIISCGIVDYVKARSLGGRQSNVYFIKPDRDDWMYFDRKTGQIVHRYIDSHSMYDKATSSIRRVLLYIGPEGVSGTRDKTLGWFIDPIIDRNSIYLIPEKQSNLILYDKKLRRFFKIDFNKKTIIKGPKLKKDSSHKPIQLGLLSKNTSFLYDLSWTPPEIKVSDLETDDLSKYFNKITHLFYTHLHGPYLLVLDETGRIDLLDKETLKFVGTAGRLPVTTKYPLPTQSSPEDLLSYSVVPLFLGAHISEDISESEYKEMLRGGTSQKNKELQNMYLENTGPAYQASPYGTYLPPHLFMHGRTTEIIHPGEENECKYIYTGMFATTLSRDRTAMVLVAFDEKGKEIKKVYNKITKHGARDILYVYPGHATPNWPKPHMANWSSALIIGKYMVEILHPPILSAVSYFTASSFEPTPCPKELFILPNSFIAMKGRDMKKNVTERFIPALLLLLPSIILTICLTWRVNKDAVVVGLSRNTKLYWIIGTLAFGLTSYITYRLTRPKATLIICANCGNPRRPDTDRCHRCGSKWNVPELIPPTWRVIDK